MNNDAVIENLICQLKPHLSSLNSKPVILCIGSDRVTGDALGPLVGHLLTGGKADAHIYGNLTCPVTALNLVETIATISARHAGCKIIAIDSSVGPCEEIGLVRIIRGSIRPGAADGKDLPYVGDISITATVAAKSHKNLYTVRLGFVYNLALNIAKSICSALNGVSQDESLVTVS